MTKKTLSFTLIEVLVMLAVIGLALPALFSIFYTVVREQTKLYRLTQVKREGDNVMNIIENLVRSNAIGIYSSSTIIPANSICTNVSTTPTQLPNPAIYFSDKLGNAFGFQLNGSNQVDVYPTGGAVYDVTSSNITVPSPVGSNFSFSCYKPSSFANPIMNVTMNLQYNTFSTRPEDQASLLYQTSIVLRNSP